ncbi:hypothetical protein PR048_014867 [Dryococelus australis]|uniref:Uncharacterized protein n=1 Tax=Dryococelus australis TaxID=614101 RepID=A0ABQ9HG64_9NEOP|nr:hypothetical protein PR048_014867 [Dryococelus australis]
MQERGRREILRKPANQRHLRHESGSDPAGNRPGSPWWKVSDLPTELPLPQRVHDGGHVEHEEGYLWIIFCSATNQCPSGIVSFTKFLPSRFYWRVSNPCPGHKNGIAVVAYNGRNDKLLAVGKSRNNPLFKIYAGVGLRCRYLSPAYLQNDLSQGLVNTVIYLVINRNNSTAFHIVPDVLAATSCINPSYRNSRIFISEYLLELDGKPSRRDGVPYTLDDVHASLAKPERHTCVPEECLRLLKTWQDAIRRSIKPHSRGSYNRRARCGFCDGNSVTLKPAKRYFVFLSPFPPPPFPLPPPLLGWRTSERFQALSYTEERRATLLARPSAVWWLLLATSSASYSLAPSIRLSAHYSRRLLNLSEQRFDTAVTFQPSALNYSVSEQWGGAFRTLVAPEYNFHGIFRATGPRIVGLVIKETYNSFHVFFSSPSRRRRCCGAAESGERRAERGATPMPIVSGERRAMKMIGGQVAGDSCLPAPSPSDSSPRLSAPTTLPDISRISQTVPEDLDTHTAHNYLLSSGIAVVWWLDYSPPTQANQVLFPAGSHGGIVPEDAAGRRVFSGDLSPSPPPHYHFGAAPYSPRFQCFARRGDKRVDAHVSIVPSTPTLLGLRRAKFLQPGGQLKSCPNLFYHSLTLLSSVTALVHVNYGRVSISYVDEAREHCTPVQSLALSGDCLQCVALIALALLCLTQKIVPLSLMLDRFVVTTYKKQPACLDSPFWGETPLLALGLWLGRCSFLRLLFYQRRRSGEKMTRVKLSVISVYLTCCGQPRVVNSVILLSRLSADRQTALTRAAAQAFGGGGGNPPVTQVWIAVSLQGPGHRGDGQHPRPTAGRWPGRKIVLSGEADTRRLRCWPGVVTYAPAAGNNDPRRLPSPLPTKRRSRLSSIARSTSRGPAKAAASWTCVVHGNCSCTSTPFADHLWRQAGSPILSRFHDMAEAGQNEALFPVITLLVSVSLADYDLDRLNKAPVVVPERMTTPPALVLANSLYVLRRAGSGPGRGITTLCEDEGGIPPPRGAAWRGVPPAGSARESSAYSNKLLAAQAFPTTPEGWGSSLPGSRKGGEREREREMMMRRVDGAAGRMQGPGKRRQSPEITT